MGWPIALVIFVASVFVPLMKLIILTYLLISVQIKSQWRPRDRTRLYRLTEVVGRWSMVDIYVVTILVALVHLGGLANIDAGPWRDFLRRGGSDHHVRGHELRSASHMG